MSTAARCLYLDTSAVLRAVLESGTSLQLEARIATASALVTSRLSTVEGARAIHRLRATRQLAETKLADAEWEIAAVWRRCELWEITARVCETAQHVARSRPLRTLDALHLATFLLARETIAGLELLTSDQRLRDAADAL